MDSGNRQQYDRQGHWKPLNMMQNLTVSVPVARKSGAEVASADRALALCAGPTHQSIR